MIWGYNLMKSKSVTVRFAHRNVWYKKLGRWLKQNHLPLGIGFLLMVWSFIAGLNAMAWLVS